MGQWNMTIVGAGAHHNEKNPSDADKLLRRFVAELKREGHNIQHASITTGSLDYIPTDEELSAPSGG